MTTAGRAPVAPDEEVTALAERLYLTVVHLLRRMKRADDGLGLSTAQISAITRLVASGPLPVGELAAAEGVRPPTMTRLVQRLEQDGLVLRERSTHDARVTLIRSTSRAAIALEEGRRRRAAAFAEDLGALSERDRERLTTALDVLDVLSGATERAGGR